VKDSKTRLVPKLRFPEFRDATEWGETTIAQACKSFSGGTPSTSQKEFYGGSIPFMRSAEIARDETELFLTDEGLKKSAAKLIAKGDVLVALYGANSGDVALARIDGAINQAILCLKSEGSNPYIYQFLRHRQDWITSTYLQGGQGNLSGDIVKSISVPFPEAAEQQKITDCLSSLDELIAAQARKVDALKTHKKGLMQQLFPREGETQPRLRFPEFRDSAEWTPTALGSIASFSSGGTPSKDNPDYWNGSIPWVSASSMYELHISRADHYVTPLAIGNGTRIAKKGTLLILVRGSMLFKRVPMCIAAVDVAFNQDVKALKVDPLVDGAFLIYQLLTNEDRIPINETGIGAGKIELADLKEFGLFIPSQLEQRRIANCLSNLDDLITAATQELETLKIQKKGLMQQLFPSAEVDA
jgi:type I restriction enzyme S subunit